MLWAVHIYEINVCVDNGKEALNEKSLSSNLAAVHAGGFSTGIYQTNRSGKDQIVNESFALCIGYRLIFHHQRVSVSVYCWGQSRQHPRRWRSGAAGQGRLGKSGRYNGNYDGHGEQTVRLYYGACDNLSLIMIITNWAPLPSPDLKYSFLVASSSGDRPLRRRRSSRRGDETISYESRIVILVSFHTISGVIPNSSFYDPLTTTWWKVEGVISWQHLLEIGNNASEGNLRARLANIAINQVVVMETRPSEMEVSPLILDNQSPSNNWGHRIPGIIKFLWIIIVHTFIWNDPETIRSWKTMSIWNYYKTTNIRLK